MSPNNEINIDQYKKYLSGTMTAEELASFERKLELDPFAKEALEGFTQMEQPAEMVASITSIEEKIGALTGIEKSATPVIPLFRIASIAAVLIAVIGGGFLLSKMLSTNDSLAENHTTSDEKTPELDAKKDKSPTTTLDNLGYLDTVTLNFSDLSESELEISDSESSEPEITSDVSDEVATINQPTIEQSTDFRNNGMNVAEEELEEIPLAEIASNTERKTNPSSVERTASSQDASVVPTAAPSESDYQYNAETVNMDDLALEDEAKKEVASFYQGLRSYQNSNYGEAVNAFGKSIAENQKIAESNYYLGLSYMNLNKDLKAIKAFEQVINSPSSLKNNAKWYKASILIKKGKNAEAKTLLQELVDSNSSFKQSALEKLDGL